MKACLSPNGLQRYVNCGIGNNSIHASVALIIACTDPSSSQRPSQRHPSHIRPRRRHRAHQSRQHSRFQHRNVSRHRHPHSILHHLHLNHHLAQTRRRAALAFALQHGPRVRSLCECSCVGVAMLGVCDCFLPQCACAAADDGGYELVGCCVPGCGTVQRGLLRCLGKEEVRWAGGVCEEA